MQTSFSDDPAIGYPGQPADCGLKDDVSRIVDEADGIAFGVVVVRGTDPTTQASLPGATSTADDILGVSLRAHATEGLHAHRRALPIRRIGRVKVTVESAFTPASPVYFRIVPSVNGTELGALRTDDDGGTAVGWSSARFVSSGTAGAVGVLQILQG